MRRADKSLGFYRAQLALLVLSSVVSTVLSAESVSRNPLAYTPATIVSARARPNNIYALPNKTDKEFYESYIQPSDVVTTKWYGERWGVPGNHWYQGQASWMYENCLPQQVGRTSEEERTRRDFANQILRLRVQSAVFTYLADPARPAEVRKAAALAQSAHNVGVVSSGNTKTGGEFRVDYDMITDATRIEFRSETFRAGFFHPHLMTSVLSGRTDDGAGLGATYRLGINQPAVSLQYPVQGTMLQGGVSQPLSQQVDAAVLTTAPLGNSGVPTSFQMTVAYRF